MISCKTEISEMKKTETFNPMHNQTTFKWQMSKPEKQFLTHSWYYTSKSG